MLALYPTYVRQFMIVAHSMNMTAGNFVFFHCQAIESVRRFGFLAWDNNDEHDHVAREAYRTIFQLSGGCHMRQADYRSKQQIVNRIKSRTIQKYNITFLPREQVSDFVLSAYNALLFYAQVLNETSRLPQPDYSGEVIAKKSWNRTFTLPSGPVYLDSSGERLWDICVRGLQKSSWDFEPVMRFSTQRRRLIDHRENTIEWPEDYSWPPPSSPKTLLSNKEALVWSNQLPVTTAVVLLCVALLVLGMVVSTVWFREKHGLPRGDRWWKIHRHEIATKDGSDGLCAFIHSEAEETVESGWGQQCFYKDKLVSLRRISTTEDFPPSRSALRLLWQVPAV
ncbi:hypothetical protein RvY_15398-2 [Ramazzottius varieornatus]|uniref:Receptor ligand binding region domain-containing protein n=1 Tax=Ramazzottius varieornatus TaxID=947166 RepID=A0A1D1VUS7_RAMVA|nr:hypothetical protein RvY_15398-2 [Ramazzottius varieornatus]